MFLRKERERETPSYNWPALVTAAKMMLTAALGDAPVESRTIECATKSAPSVNGGTMGV